MTDYKIFKIDTSTGVLEIKGIPVCNDFDYKAFALTNGFFYQKINSPENTGKYGGIGFVSFRNFNDTSEIPYYEKKTLSFVFENGLPLMYSVS